jgi:hypothetical protein
MYEIKIGLVLKRLLKEHRKTLKEVSKVTDQKCDGLRLCTGIENESGKRFYEREGWTLKAVAFKKKI